MVSAINTAVSGLNAAATRLNVSANNTANQFSTKSKANGKAVDKPYVPQKVDQVTLSNGGVQSKVKDVNPPAVTVADTSNPKGTSELPNVNPDQEVINQVTAAQSYEANLKTIKIANDTLKSLLDIKT